jgi:hypothetical protein
MKFRYRGGTTGFIARTGGRMAKSAYSNGDGGSCLKAILIITFSPFIIPILLLNVSFKNRFPQKIASWFFLKEDEPDGTVLPIGEIQNRIKEFLKI